MFDCFKPNRSEPKPGGETIPTEVAEVFEMMKTHTAFNDPRYIAQLDYKINSMYPRLFIYDRKDRKLHKFKCAHGSGGSNIIPHDGVTREVSNVEGSHMSCVGLFKCAETYYGSKGYSMRLDGLSNTNSLARQRDIVMHDSSYVTDGNNHICGRSWGCPSMSEKNSRRNIDMLKGGSPLLAVI
jgi:hypothetical protein